MKEVRILVTVGPQGAGKTTFCEQLVKEVPGLAYANRDKFLEERYGKAAWNPYTGCMEEGLKEFYQHIASLVNENDVVLVECFHLGLAQFGYMMHQIRTEIDYTSRSVVYEALQFTTPENVCVDWYVGRYKPEDNFVKHYADLARHNFKQFWRINHSFAEKFESVLEVDPSQPPLFPYAEVLCLLDGSEPRL